MGEWEDAPAWLHDAIRAQPGGFTVEEWEEWEPIRRRLAELEIKFERAGADDRLRSIAAYRHGTWVAGVPVRWDDDTRPVMPALRELFKAVVAL